MSQIGSFAPYMEVCIPLVEEVRELAARAEKQGSAIAFQSTLAAAAQTVQRALRREEVAEKAALSLAQQDALRGMSGELRAVSDVLQSSLDHQGRCLMPADPNAKSWSARLARKVRAPRKSDPVQCPTWWFSLTEAIETLEEGADRMDALASGQAAEAPSRALGQATAGLLRSHQDRLLSEADRWID
jgi:hypothetical protein